MAIAGNDIQISNTSQAVNSLTFNPIISAITGYGAASPTVTAPITASPSTTTDLRGGTDSLSLMGSGGGLGGLFGGGSSMAGRIDTAQAYPVAGMGGSNSSGVSLKTNSQTMMWLMLAGGFGLVLMMGTGSGGSRRR